MTISKTLFSMHQSIKVNNIFVDRVTKYQYLGTILNHTAEINKRVEITISAFMKMKLLLPTKLFA